MGRQESFMYHYSPGLDSKESVQKHGLLTHDPRHPGAKSLAEDDGHPAGVYLFHDRRQADMLEEGHTWKVNTKGLQLHDDPFHAGKGVASYSPEPVPSDRLEHLGEV